MEAPVSTLQEIAASDGDTNQAAAATELLRRARVPSQVFSPPIPFVFIHFGRANLRQAFRRRWCHAIWCVVEPGQTVCVCVWWSRARLCVFVVEPCQTACVCG